MQEVNLYTMDMFQEYKKISENHIYQFLLLKLYKMPLNTLLFIFLRVFRLAANMPLILAIAIFNHTILYQHQHKLMSAHQRNQAEPLREFSFFSFLNTFASKIKNGLLSFFYPSSLSQVLVQGQQQSKDVQMRLRYRSIRRQRRKNLKISEKYSLMRFLEKILNQRAFNFFYQNCIKKYRVRDGKESTLIIFLFVRVMLDHNQIDFNTYLKIKNYIRASLQYLIPYERKKNNRSSSHSYLLRMNRYKILSAHLRMLDFCEKKTRFSQISAIVQTFYSDIRAFEMGIRKIRRVIKDHSILTAIFIDFD